MATSDTLHTRNAGRFRAGYRDEELLWLVRIALEQQRSTGVAGLSRSDYDRLRHTIGHPDAPPATRITTRLALPWSEIVEPALGESRDIPRTLGKRAGAPRSIKATQLDLDRAVSALRSVATRLLVEQLSAMAYDTERERIAHESQQTAILPTSNQIARLYNLSWTQATRAAGLAPGGRGRCPGLSLTDANEVCLHTTGALPTHAEMWRFARANNIAIARNRNGRNPNWTASLKLLRTRRAAPAKRDRPDYDAPILTQAPRPPARPPWSTEECIQGLIAFMDWLAEHGEANHAAKQRRYNRWSATHPEHPRGNTIVVHGGFTALLPQPCAAAATRRRAPSPTSLGFSRCSAPRARPTSGASSRTPSSATRSPPPSSCPSSASKSRPSTRNYRNSAPSASSNASNRSHEPTGAETGPTSSGSSPTRNTTMRHRTEMGGRGVS